jgi:hypothetical protein
MAFRFPQRLSDFFNGFPIFLTGFPIFLNGFPLSEKSEKNYLRQQVYERSPFELCVSCHLLPELRNCHSLPKLCNCHSLSKLCNCHSLPELCNHYNVCISPNRLVSGERAQMLADISRHLTEASGQNIYRVCGVHRQWLGKNVQHACM